MGGGEGGGNVNREREAEGRQILDCKFKENTPFNKSTSGQRDGKHEPSQT